MDEQEGFGEKGAVALKKPRNAAPSTDIMEDMADEDIWAAMEDLERARASAEVEAPIVDTEFVCNVRGCDRHYLRTGQADDALHTANRTRDGKDFCIRFRLTRTFKATYTEHGVEPSQVMCRAWAHRMQHVFAVSSAPLINIRLSSRPMTKLRI